MGEGKVLHSTHRLVHSKHVQAQVHGAGRVGQFNTWLALKITGTVGTMWAAYVFAGLAFISFPQAVLAFLRGDFVTGVAWVAQTFLQLVLLPIIIVGQNVQQQANDLRAAADHETLVHLDALQVQQLDLLQGQQEILKLLNPNKPGAAGSGQG